MSDETDFYERTGFNTFEEAKAAHEGYLRAIKEARYCMNERGKPTSWFDAMLDEMEEVEHDYFACQVVGG